MADELQEKQCQEKGGVIGLLLGFFLGGGIIKNRWLVVYLFFYFGFFFLFFFEQTGNESWGEQLEDNLEWKRRKDPEPC